MNPIRWVLHALLGDDPPREPKPDEIVRLSVDTNGIELQSWVDILRKHGIRCELEPVGWANAVGGGQSTDFVILVQYRDVARARELLALPDRDSTV